MLKLKSMMGLFRVPSPAELAQRELVEAQRELLKAHSGREYADAMVTYQQRRVMRLQATMAQLQPAANDPNAQPLQRAA